MKVYVVMFIISENASIEKVFAVKEHAEIYIKAESGKCWYGRHFIEEHEIEDMTK